MLKELCNLIEVLTGFKYIGEKILGFETTGKGHYCFGFEESYGCLIGTHARDKDAVVATMALCEAVAYYKTKGNVPASFIWLISYSARRHPDIFPVKT